MIVPDWIRLFLYIVMGIGPLWSDFLAKSSDYSLRGLLMPVVASVVMAATVTLARTKGRNEMPPAQP